MKNVTKRGADTPTQTPQTSQVPARRPATEQPAQNGKWKIFIFLLPGGHQPGPPRKPNGKHWLEIALMLLKVLAAVFALIKAVGILS